MRTLPEVLGALQSAQYLSGCLANNGHKLVDLGMQQVKILANGKRYADQLKQHWRLAQTDNMPRPHFGAPGLQAETKAACSNRLGFLRTKHFHDTVQLLRAHSQAQCPALVKSELHKMADGNSENSNAVQLVSDYFFHAASALENFYNIQRERKIWWMRFSANPSRFFLEPYDLSSNEECLPANSQSITIKSRFTFGIADVEQITLVPLREARLQHSEEYQLKYEPTGKPVLPAVIRSVIDLEAATSAMLLDGNDHGRENTLLLNRKLVPYQCVVSCLHKNKYLPDLHDLCTHLNCVLRRAGLRIFDEQSTFTDSKVELSSALHAADSIGIPYALIITENTLQTGILKLRSRDTTLEETIHISDIPAYLLNIFMC